MGRLVTVVARDLALPLAESAEPEPALARLLAKRFGIEPASLPPPQITRRALDTRQRHPRYVYSATVTLAAGLANRLIGQKRAEPFTPHTPYRWVLRAPPDGPPPVVVGAGPAGLFAALTLAEGGWPATILERGRPVEQRGKDVSALYSRGVLNQESNVCFGEGGAGTYSDGKLYTRTNDPRVTTFLQRLVELGAEPAVRIDNRPHIGTDRLVLLLKKLRRRLFELGTVFHFETRVTDFEIADGHLLALRCAGGQRFAGGPVVLATGHSARDVMASLDRAGLHLEIRAFAVGFRVEHPQALINQIRYGGYTGHTMLPAADYRLAHNEGQKGQRRGVYSFCMCPGGVVVATPTLPDELCVNGMSHKSRAGRFANSGLVVTVGPEDFLRAGHRGPMAGVLFQRHVERAAFAAGGGGFAAPAARLADFAAGRACSSVGGSAYRRGLCVAELDALYPKEIMAALRRGLQRFDKTMPGFVTNEANLIGVETRTASPLRLPRDAQFEAQEARGLYPCGEGLGYGGGIASSAVDGIRVAEAILEAAGARREDVTVPS